jgi:lipopolysaccharide transport system ATP-binding protein
MDSDKVTLPDQTADNAKTTPDESSLSDANIESRQGNESTNLFERELMIAAHDVGKMYRLYQHPQDRLKEQLFWRFGRHYGHEFWALHDISLEVRKGETVGIIGRNGSGKSTLLQVIAGTIAPTTGLVQVKGRVAALLELGSGFNLEFTGRENVFLNGSILGISYEEMEARFEQIRAYADIGDFIDQPVKLYSSGMVVRLAFAVATSVEPDVLIIDEALAVGDARFQLACYETLQKMLQRGVTLLFVSHDGNAIKQLCQRAIVLENGAQVFEGKPNDALNFYSELLFPGKTRANSTGHAINLPLSSRKQTEFAHVGPETRTNEYRYGTHKGQITFATLLGEAGEPSLVVESGEKTIMRFLAEIHEDIDKPILAMTIKNHKGVEVYGTNTLYQDVFVRPLKAGERIIVEFYQDMALMAGTYFFSLGFVELVDNDLKPIDRRYDVMEFKITPRDRSFGIANLRSVIAVEISEPTQA